MEGYIGLKAPELISLTEMRIYDYSYTVIEAIRRNCPHMQKVDLYCASTGVRSTQMHFIGSAWKIQPSL